MPAVAVSSQISDAVYMASIIALAVLLARPVYLVYAASQQRGAEAVAAGIGTMIDSMSPGTSVVTSLESYPCVQLSVVLDGNTVAASFGKSTATSQVSKALPMTTLSPGVLYNFTLDGGKLVVAPARNG